MRKFIEHSGVRTFLIVSFGQIISGFGTSLSNFALGIWVLGRTGSVTQYGLIILIASLPGLLVSPLAGVLADRWDRRFAMLLGDSGAAACTLAMAGLLYMGRLEVWHLAIAVAISSTFSALQTPAHAASVALLVPKKQLGRASGIVQIGSAAGNILAPLMAGVLMDVINIQGVLLVDFLTFIAAVITLLLVRIPRPPHSASQATGKRSLFRDAAAGWSFIRERPGLFGLMAYFAIIFFFVSMSNVLMAPMMLAFASFTVIGSIISCAAIGMLVGSLVMGAWGGPKNRVYGVFGFALLQSLSFSLSGLRPNALLVGVASVIESASLPIIHGCNRVIWQVKTPPEIQGRVFATSSMILRSTGPLGFIIAGPLADKVFEPLLVVNGPLAGSLGKVVGVGPGRGIGLMMVVMGLIMTLVTIAAFMNSHIRGIQQELPDCVPDEIIATDAKVSENTVVAHA